MVEKESCHICKKQIETEKKEETKIECWSCKNKIEVGEERKLSDTVVDGKILCEKCYANKTYECNSCHDVHIETIHESYDMNGDVICDSCESDTFVCDSCDNRLWNNDESEDSGICQSCYNDNEHNHDNQEDLFFRNNTHFENTEPTKDNNVKTFGVEIECIAQDELNPSDFLHFNCVEDGSLNENGVEFVSVPFKIEHKKTMKKEINKIADLCDIDRSCGLHLHTYINGQYQKLRHLKNLFLIYWKFEDEFFSMMPVSREDNRYCIRLTKDFSINKILDMKKKSEFLTYYYGYLIQTARNTPKDKYCDKRYYWINLHSLFYRNTLENRLHSGTVNFEKIWNWIRINKSVIDFALKSSVEEIQAMTNDEFYSKVIKDEELIKYMKERQDKFGKAWKKYALSNNNALKQMIKNGTIDVDKLDIKQGEKVYEVNHKTIGGKRCIEIILKKDKKERKLVLEIMMGAK
jgi:hypothetical protein